MVEKKTTNEIIKPCIEYKSIIFTEHWTKTKNQEWVRAEEHIKEIEEWKTIADDQSYKLNKLIQRYNKLLKLYKGFHDEGCEGTMCYCSKRREKELEGLE